MDGFRVLAKCEQQRQFGANILSSSPRVTEMGDATSNLDDDPSNNNKLFKVLVVGNPLVGKSSFVFRYVHGKYTRFQATIGVDFALKKIERPNKETVRLQIWDIAGQEYFGSLTKLYYRKASACIIMFDVSDAKSFQDVGKWKHDVDQNVQLPDGRPIPCMLLGNKTDLSNRRIQDEDIKSLCRDSSFIGWSTISVKDNTNIAGPMMFLVERILETENKSNMCKTDLFTTSDGNIRLPDEPENSSRFCCSI
ncbi:putative ras-related protein [Apostichopus japonicus]|uniref:Putative ras-related protein n=1 Tax=Stichopus japonicus TaxID=307972 RepID=A0A2G8JX29_STIJA|nr:putative ras-related protein [Apostichopus japonicus]